MKTSPEVIQFIQAIGSLDRLKIISAVADTPLTQEEISKQLNLNPDTSKNQLDMLIEQKLVNTVEYPDGIRYQMDWKRINGLARAQFKQERQIKLVVEGALDEDEIRLLSGFLTTDGRLEQLPTKGIKLQTALKYAAAVIEPGRDYSEKEVNDALRQINTDTAILRRYLVDFGLLQRERDGSRYWREAETNA